MKSNIAKRSVVIGGHKTSVSLEEPFWQCVREITHTRAISVSDLLQEIDRDRQKSNLSSAVRVFVLEQARRRAETVALPQPREVITEAR
jgi:predicted DNA-binding ribbon-helix-helix protein